MTYIEQLINLNEVATVYSYYMNNKHYIFLGDVHNSREDNTYNIPEKLLILQEWLKYNLSKNILTDFYLEAEYTKNNKRLFNQNLKTSSIMLLCQYYLHDCFIVNKNHLYHPYIHMHYADIRSYDNMTNICYADPFLIIAYIPNELIFDDEDIKSLFSLIQYILNHSDIILNGLLQQFDEKKNYGSF